MYALSLLVAVIKEILLETEIRECEIFSAFLSENFDEVGLTKMNSYSQRHSD